MLFSKKIASLEAENAQLRSQLAGKAPASAEGAQVPARTARAAAAVVEDAVQTSPRRAAVQAHVEDLRAELAETTDPAERFKICTELREARRK